MTSIRTRSRGVRRFGIRLATGSAWLLLAVTPLSAPAQGFGPDPFRPFNSQYDSYVYPISPGPFDPVGNPGLNRAGVRGANRFDDYLNGIGSGNNRYDQLYRSQISSHRQSFRPTTEADAKFEDQQSALTSLYFKYLRERDPAKRAALLKQYTKARNESTRSVSAAGRAASGRKAQKPRTGGEDAEDAMSEDETGDEAAERAVSPPRRAAGRAATPRGRSGAAVPPPPPILGGSESRPGSSRTRDRKPSEILNRAVQSERASRGARNTPSPPPITP